MKRIYNMYSGAFGFMDFVGTHETEDEEDMKHKVKTGEISYYELVKEEL